MGKPMAALPPDIIVDIFLKLPAKSLCRFKCLSKSFMALITNPRFVKMHQTQNKRQTLVAATNNCLFCADLDSKFITVHHLDFPIKKARYGEVYIHGSCNGLFCLSASEETGTEPLFIYNCSTREFKRIPSYAPLGCRLLASSSKAGFGYAESIDDFKVFGVSQSYIDRLQGVHVFSLRNNTWKTFETNWDDFIPCDRAIHLNGTIHFGFCKPKNQALMIAAFDLEEDEFRFLPLPGDVFDFYSLALYSIRVMGDCVCLLAHWDGANWIMKEYGVKESWTTISSLFCGISCLKPLCSLKESDFTLYDVFDKFILVNPKDGTCKYFVIDGFPEYPTARGWRQVYTESLISPNSKTNFLTSEGALDLELSAAADDQARYKKWGKINN